MRKLPIFALSVLALSAATAAGAVSSYPVTELFPAEPGINAERGFAMAVDGDWLAVGAPRDDRDPERKDAGAVYLFQWSGTTWDQKAKLFAATPQAKAHLGFALAMRNGVLAAGAPGEGPEGAEGAVYVFALRDDGWAQEKRLFAPEPDVRNFGRSLALDGDHLAVGAGGFDGVTDGAVYIYDVPTWNRERLVPPRGRQREERFGSAVSLAGGVLIVGAPGYDVPSAADAGAVYVFQRGPGGRWREKAKLLPLDSPPGGLSLAGQQLGFSVATDGTEIFAGAPTADFAGPSLKNSGAVYRFGRVGDGWRRGELLHGEELGAEEQLGASLALSGDLLVVGAPAPPPGNGKGRLHLFRRTGASWSEVRFPVAGNAEVRDLAGFAVAVGDAVDDEGKQSKRVVAGSVLGDQGDRAAGAVWSFKCLMDPDEEGCVEEAEAVARDDLAGRRFGVSVALTKELMAVGAPESDESFTGAVYLYGRAGDGWRQEERLTSAYRGDGFGSSVALEGSLLAVGAPQGRSILSGDPYPKGNVDLFVRSDSSWSLEATLVSPCGTTDFGTSVAISGGVVAVGSPGCKAVYLFEKVDEDWNEVKVSVLTDSAEGFGSAVSLRGGVLAIGAPGANNGKGRMFISVREGQRWTNPQVMVDAVKDPLGVGSSVAVGDGGTFAVGAPGFDGGGGAVFLFNFDGVPSVRRLSALAPRRFGASVALLGNRLVVGGPGEDTATFFERNPAGDWEVAADLRALQPPHGDEFGGAVALSEDFIAVTSPGPERGDRVTVFRLPRPTGGDQ